MRTPTETPTAADRQAHADALRAVTAARCALYDARLALRRGVGTPDAVHEAETALAAATATATK